MTRVALNSFFHYNDVIMNLMAPQMTSLMITYSPVYSGTDQRKHQSFASQAFVRGIHRRLVNSPHKGPVTRKMFPFDDVIMSQINMPSSLRTLLEILYLGSFFYMYGSEHKSCLKFDIFIKNEIGCIKVPITDLVTHTLKNCLWQNMKIFP